MIKYTLYAKTNKNNVVGLERTIQRFKTKLCVAKVLFKWLFLIDTSDCVIVFGSEKFKDYIHDLLTSSSAKQWEFK